MKLSDEIRRAIQSSGLSRYEIAKRSGVQQSALSRFVRGEGLSTASLDRLAPVLGLHLVVDPARHQTEKTERKRRWKRQKGR